MYVTVPVYVKHCQPQKQQQAQHKQQAVQCYTLRSYCIESTYAAVAVQSCQHLLSRCTGSLCWAPPQ
jgi:hypothetical protein